MVQEVVGKHDRRKTSVKHFFSVQGAAYPWVRDMVLCGLDARRIRIRAGVVDELRVPKKYCSISSQVFVRCVSST